MTLAGPTMITARMVWRRRLRLHIMVNPVRVWVKLGRLDDPQVDIPQGGTTQGRPLAGPRGFQRSGSEAKGDWQQVRATAFEAAQLIKPALCAVVEPLVGDLWRSVHV